MAQDFKSSAKSRRKARRKKIEIKKKEFIYQGLKLEELQKLTIDELLPLLPSRIRRTLKRGLTARQEKLIKDIDHAGTGVPIRTHCRNMVILPKFVGHIINIHNGKEFLRVNIQPEMIGHYLGEFALTRQRVKHTGPGVGATKSSKFMPLKWWKMKYSTYIDTDKSAKAFGYELHCSKKDSMNIAYAIKGMKIDEAKKFLQDIIDLKRSLKAIYHKKKIHHQKSIGPGSFPQKAAKYMLETLENAENNAEYKGFDVENMKITHVSAYGGRVLKAMMPRAHGISTNKYEETTDIEIIIEEVE